MELKNYFAQDKEGAVIPGASVYLYEEGTTNPVEGIQDANGNALTNPFQADEDGLFQVSAPDGVYDLRVTSSGKDNTIKVHFLDASAAVENITNSANRAENEANRAESEADRAQLGAESALTSGWIYTSVVDGEAARTDGDYFWIVSDSEDKVLELWLMGVSSATDTGKRTYSSNKVEAVDSRMARLKEDMSGFTDFVGIDDRVPIVTDSEMKILFGFNRKTGKLFGVGIGEEAAKSAIGKYGVAEFLGSDIHPVLTDKYGKVLLGYDDTAKAVFAAGMYSASETDTKISNVTREQDKEPLNEPIIPKAINHVISYGQSLAIGASGQPVISTTQPYQNITFAGGPRAWDGTSYLWGPFKPLVEDQVSPSPDGRDDRGETVCSGAANYATTLRAIDGLAPSDHVILASATGYGGLTIDNFEKGTYQYSLFINHVQQANDINPDHAVHAVFWLQGERDVVEQTDYATYKSKLEQLSLDIEADVQAITGQTSPVYLLLYQTCARSVTWTDIQSAQLDAANENNKIFFSAPIYHLPHSDDNIHLTAKGYKWAGGYFGKSYKQILDGNKPQWLNPISATRRGTTVRVKFDVPARPLVLDTTNLAETTDYGFAVEDENGLLTINSITIDKDDVVIVLSSEPIGNATVRYAMDYLGTGLSMQSAASGNLRDSASGQITVEGEDMPLFNAAPHFALTVVSLGE